MRWQACLMSFACPCDGLKPAESLRQCLRLCTSSEAGDCSLWGLIQTIVSEGLPSRSSRILLAPGPRDLAPPWLPPHTCYAPSTYSGSASTAYPPSAHTGPAPSPATGSFPDVPPVCPTSVLPLSRLFD